MKIDENNLIYGLVKTENGYIFISKKKDEIYNLVKTIINISKNKIKREHFPLDFEVDDNNQVHIFLKEGTLIIDMNCYKKK